MFKSLLVCIKFCQKASLIYMSLFYQSHPRQHDGAIIVTLVIIDNFFYNNIFTKARSILAFFVN